MASLVVLLQAVWVGLFIHEGRDYSQGWVEVHAGGADVVIGIAVIALVEIFCSVRCCSSSPWCSRRTSVDSSGNRSSLTVAHFPLGMAIMGLAVWLPFRAARRG